MNTAPRKKIFRKLTQKGFSPKHVAEVGVYLPETSNVYDYIKNDIRATLVEPSKKAVEAIRQHFPGKTNIELHSVAVYDRNGEVELVEQNASTFIGEGVASPAIVNDGYEVKPADRFTVPAVTFDKIDDGTIDLLSIDIEGGEWFVLKHMVSRPGVISVETHGAIYINPHLDKILHWMHDQGYTTWYKDKSDTVFVRNGLFPVRLGEKTLLTLINLRIRLRRARKTLVQKLIPK